MTHKSLLTTDARTKRRNASEARFKAYGLGGHCRRRCWRSRSC